MAGKLVVNSTRYKDALEHTSTYNSRLVFERKQRSPFLDSQTGVAQVNCHLWKSKLVRRAPAYPYQLYSYPGRRWKSLPKKVPTPAPSEPEEEEPIEEQVAQPSEVAANPVPITTELNSLFEVKEEPPVVEAAAEEGEEESEEESENESDDEEENLPISNRRPGRPGRPPRRTQPNTNNPVIFSKQQGNPYALKVRNYTKEELSKMNYEDRQKPYVCELCGRRYKNGPGLKYHYTHYNHDQEELNTSDTMAEGPSVAPSQPPTTATAIPTTTSSSSSLPEPSSHLLTKPSMEPKKDKEGCITPNDYCDFCLGDVNENKKTFASEELLSCADCGRSGHPTCLQFTLKLTNNVKKYRWQCIECKSCTLCGTSDNDDQLLFCDDCDRGYHMYCLKPPMETPPEGSWICKLCEEDDMDVNA